MLITSITGMSIVFNFLTRVVAIEIKGGFPQLGRFTCGVLLHHSDILPLNNGFDRVKDMSLVTK